MSEGAFATFVTVYYYFGYTEFHKIKGMNG